jgi:phosphoglucomutase/phosphomannomutase
MSLPNYNDNGPHPEDRQSNTIEASMDLLSQAAEGFKTVEADAALKEQALDFLKQWLADAEFANYRPQLHWMIETKQWAGLLDRFCQILPFGTGGRRGGVGIGPNRMNLWTLGASVQGHCEYLKECFPGVEPLRVVLAYDVRQFEDKRKNYNPDLPNPVLHLSSKGLAQHAAGIYVHNGIHVHILPPDSKSYMSTPELSFAIRRLGAHGGLNVSASHNPPDDNGGKFYDDRGGQPVAPDDQIMSDHVKEVTTIRTLAWSDAQRGGRVHFLELLVHQAYIDLCRKQSLIAAPRFDELQVVFTPLHGVGSMTAMETLTSQGFRVIPVEEQMTPDGQFPNVTQTPNPEVPASMDRAAALAQKSSADLVLSTDPDADRLGAMIPERDGRWRFLTGNQIAALVTHFKLSKLAENGTMPPSPIVVRTEVTTSLVTRIARRFGAQVVENLLVGFKFIAEVLHQLDEKGAYEDVTGTCKDFVIACEESHGILATSEMRDKDAAAAALILAELALDQKRRGRLVLDYLLAIYQQFGYFGNQGHTIAMPGIQGKQDMARMLAALRAAPLKEIGGLSVTSFEDLADEKGRLGNLKGDTDLLSRNFLIFRLGDRAKVVIRPSGTEPKAKIYVEVGSPPKTAGVSADAWQKACAEVDNLCGRMAKDFQKKALALIGMER